DLEAGVHERTDGGLAARTRALDHDVDRTQTVLHGTTGALFGGELRGERRRLTRALEAHVARRRPGNDVALRVGDRNDRVVEGRLDVHHAVRDVLAFLLARATTSRRRLCHH